MDASTKKRALFIGGLVGINIFLDQITKIIVRNSIELHEHIQVIGDYAILTKVENTGAFLSMGSNLSPVLRSIIFSWLPAAAMIGILIYLLRQKDTTRTVLIGICLMVGGGIGNLIDRILHGSVTDFMHIDLGGWAKTGVFNVADISITAGCIIIILASLRKKKPETTPEEDSQGAEAQVTDN